LIAITGVGHSNFGKQPEITVQDLCVDPFEEAIKDANVQHQDIGILVIGTSPEYHTQRSIGGIITEYLGLNPNPVLLTEAACASGSAALHIAASYIKAGLVDTACVIGIQKMSELTNAEVQSLMGRVGDIQWESGFGTTFPGYYAFFAQRHMAEFGTTSEQLAKIAVKNHKYGAENPKAMFRNKRNVSIEKVLSSKMVADPLKVYDCCANADGAACVILQKEDVISSESYPIWLTGMGVATGPMSVLTRENLTELTSTRIASQQAYKMSKRTPKDIQVASVHDCFTIAELMAYEDLGFCEKGKGGEFVDEEENTLNGSTPVNLDGGLKAKGHPIGATGISMIHSTVKQLRGEAAAFQIPDCSVGLTHNIGGIGQYCYVNILEKKK
jgi:acetyl-CoA C-acetyltransferase